MKKILLTLLVCLPFLGNGQSFIKSFGTNGSTEHCLTAQQTTDGGYILLSLVEDTLTWTDYTKLIKTNNLGDTLWTKTFTNHIYGTTVNQTTDGGYIISGINNLNGSINSSLIKTDGNGYITSIINIPIKSTNRKLKSIRNLLGQKTKEEANTPLFYIFDDGTIEKKIIIE